MLQYSNYSQERMMTPLDGNATLERWKWGLPPAWQNIARSKVTALDKFERLSSQHPQTDNPTGNSNPLYTPRAPSAGRSPKAHSLRFFLIRQRIVVRESSLLFLSRLLSLQISFCPSRRTSGPHFHSVSLPLFQRIQPPSHHQYAKMSHVRHFPKHPKYLLLRGEL